MDEGAKGECHFDGTLYGICTVHSRDFRSCWTALRAQLTAEEGPKNRLKALLISMPERWPATSGSPEDIAILVIESLKAQLAATERERDRLRTDYFAGNALTTERDALREAVRAAKHLIENADRYGTSTWIIGRGAWLALPSVQQAVGKEGKP